MADPEELCRTTFYKIKYITFHGRKVSIVLQNENGPCPLIAICNILLLRNSITVRPDGDEADGDQVSLGQLVQAMGNALVDIGENERGEERLRKREECMSFVMENLKFLIEGLEIDVGFRHIRDFVPREELQFFYLQNISLFHGWLIDPQDEDTSRAIGSMTYNTLSDIVARRRSCMPEEPKPELSMPESIRIPPADIDDEVDFVAATTATLGVPSPSRKSMEGLQFPFGTGDVDAGPLPDQWSQVEHPTTTEVENGFVSVTESELRDDGSAGVPDFTSGEVEQQKPTTDTPQSSSIPSDYEYLQAERPSESSGFEQSIAVQSLIETCHQLELGSEEKPADMAEATNGSGAEDTNGSGSGTEETNGSSTNVEEPLYEGEPTIFQATYEREPLYEGEAALQNDSSISSEDEKLIESFVLQNNQLTWHGLFSIIEGVNDNELCALFRNNHFSTMYKYNQGIFLLMADQGFLHEQHIVWQKLTGIDGDEDFYDGDFELYRPDDSTNVTWNQQESTAAVMEYMSSQDNKSMIDSDMDYALHLQKLELEQQASPRRPLSQQRDEEPQQQDADALRRRHGASPRKPSSSSSRTGLSTGRLFTGGRSNSPSSPKPEGKHKDKCRMKKKNKHKK